MFKFVNKESGDVILCVAVNEFVAWKKFSEIFIAKDWNCFEVTKEVFDNTHDFLDVI